MSPGMIPVHTGTFTFFPSNSSIEETTSILLTLPININLTWIHQEANLPWRATAEMAERADLDQGTSMPCWGWDIFPGTLPTLILPGSIQEGRAIDRGFGEGQLQTASFQVHLSSVHLQSLTAPFSHQTVQTRKAACYWLTCCLSECFQHVGYRRYYKGNLTLLK